MLLLTIVLAVGMFRLVADQSINRVYVDEVECILGVVVLPDRGGDVPGGDAQTWEQVNVGEQFQMEDFQCNENEGLKLRIKENSSTNCFVELYFTEALLQLIVTETNRYAEQYVEANTEKADSSYVGRWTLVTCSEMKVFLGLLLQTGIIQKGSLNSYCSTEELI